MFERFTERSRRVLVLAQEECRLLGHTEIGTEHVFLALISESDGVAGQVLRTFGLEAGRARSEAANLFETAEPTSGFLPFTTWAKRALELSLSEAEQLGHDYVGTEHLLLGLIRVGKGGWRSILKRFEVNERDLRASVLGIIDAYDHGDVHRTDEDLPSRPREERGALASNAEEEKGGSRVFGKFTDRARRLVVLAQQEARQHNHNYIGTEHLLLGIVHDGEGLAARALNGLGVGLEATRDQVVEIIGLGQESPSGSIPFTPRSKKVFELSLREALERGHDYIGTEHVLLGLIREGNGVATHVLENLGVSLGEARAAVDELIGAVYSDSADPPEADRASGAATSLLMAPGRGWSKHAKSGSPYEARYGFGRGVRVGDRVEIAGTAPVPPAGEDVADSAYDQMIRCCAIAREALTELGATVDDVVRTVMYITDAAYADDVGRAHGEVFGDAAPAATMVVVAGLLDPAWKVEIEVYAQL